MRAVEVGHRVIGLEVDDRRVKMLNQGESYVDDVPSRQLGEVLRTGRYHPSSDYSLAKEFDVALIAVPTPLHDGVPDLSFVEKAARALGPYLRPQCLVILESTTY